MWIQNKTSTHYRPQNIIITNVRIKVHTKYMIEQNRLNSLQINYVFNGKNKLFLFGIYFFLFIRFLIDLQIFYFLKSSTSRINYLEILQYNLFMPLK